ncbi:MAG TPA: alpha/beta fold hydrolase [Acidimicrobiales bacterium]
MPRHRVVGGTAEPAGIDLRPLVALTVAVTVLGWLDVVPVWAGLPHHVALPPLDLFADVRVLLAEAPSYPWFAAWLLAALAVRSVVLAAMLRALGRAGVVRSLRFYAVALPVALLAGTPTFAGVAAVYSPLLWVGVGVALVAVLVAAPIAWRGPRRPRGGRLTVAGYVVVLLVVSLVSALGSGQVQLAALWISAGLTAAAAHRLHGAGRAGSGDPHPRATTDPASPPEGGARPARGRPGLALVAGLLLVGAITPEGPPPQQPGSLFLVPGIGGSSGTSTMFRLDPAALGFDCERTAYFSYAGTGPGSPQRAARCPITSGAPYRAEDTRRPLDELAATFREQLADLEPPVVVVAHSQGGWVAAAGIDERAAGSVEDVVLLGAFPRHGRGYTLDGTGRGAVGTDVMEVLMAGLRTAGWTSFQPRAPLPRELLGTPGAVDDLVRSLPDGLRVATVTSALDLPVMPPDWRLPGADDLCPLYVDHGHLPVSGAVYEQIRDHLAGRDGGTGGCPWWRRWPAQAFSAFAVPP